jgi:hypothetical protein
MCYVCYCKGLRHVITQSQNWGSRRESNSHFNLRTVISYTLEHAIKLGTPTRFKLVYSLLGPKDFVR